MAFQIGLIKLEGSIGDLSFYKSTLGGYQVRKKGSVDAKRIQNDPKFARVRESNAEFRNASVAGKLIRQTFAQMLGKKKDGTLCFRLMRGMLQVVNLDAVNERGKRNVTHAGIEILTSFEFNSNGCLRNSIQLPYRAAIDRATGTFNITLPPYTPNIEIMAPKGTTHFKFNIGAAAIDFHAQKYTVALDESEVFPYNGNPLQEQILSCAITPALVKPLFLVLGINFYQEVNGTSYLLNNEHNTGLCIVAVDGNG